MIGKNGVSLKIGHNGIQDKAALAAGSETVARGIYDATTLSAVDSDLATANIKSGITVFGKAGSADVRDISDADLTEAEAPTGKTFYAVSGGKRTGTGTKLIAAGSENVEAGYHAATTLSTIDGDLATANIKSGITIFGIAGSTNVRDSTDADLTAAEAPTGKTFYAGGGAKKTGTGTKTLSAANDTVAAGYYAATTLDAVDGDLATGNIKSGVTIFGKAGSTNVRDISDADLTVGEAPTGKTFYAVSGSRKTGTGTKTLSAASESVAAGYYAATTLSAVDSDLAVGNIKTGVVIFGFTGTYAPSATEGWEKSAQQQQIVPAATWTDLTDNSVSVPAAGVCAIAWVAGKGSSNEAGDLRTVYNSVERATVAIIGAIPGGCHSATAGIGSSATLKNQAKFDGANKWLYYSSGGHYLS